MKHIGAAATGRILVVIAVCMMAAGKVAYGTWLGPVPSPVYVLFCFTLIAVIFLPSHGRRIGRLAWKPLLLLNFSTALCFLFFFYALKLIEPAVAGAIQFGVGPVMSAAFLFLAAGIVPGRRQVVVGLGLLAGCVVLAISAVQGSGFAVDAGNGWVGLVTILLSAAGSVLITLASKTLSQIGWGSGAILAHRCYVIVPMALVLVGLDEASRTMAWSADLLLPLLVVGLLGTVIPMVLLQMGIERSDAYTVLVMMAAMPILIFLIEGFSPLYVWSGMTAAGIAVIAGFIAIDVLWMRGPRTGSAALSRGEPRDMSP